MKLSDSSLALLAFRPVMASTLLVNFCKYSLCSSVGHALCKEKVHLISQKITLFISLLHHGPIVFRRSRIHPSRRSSEPRSEEVSDVVALVGIQHLLEHGQVGSLVANLHFYRAQSQPRIFVVAVETVESFVFFDRLKYGPPVIFK